MHRPVVQTALASLTLATALATAGCPAAERCPPEFPVERDGFCYAADGGAMLDAGPVDTGGAPTDTPSTSMDTGGTGTDAPGADAAVLCSGTHPLVEGTRRYCNTGECFCADPDACFPSDTADACCTVAVVCTDTDAGMSMLDASSVICTGTHPLVEGTRRYCAAGDCYCADPDACFPADTADACCPGAVVCG